MVMTVLATFSCFGRSDDQLLQKRNIMIKSVSKISEKSTFLEVTEVKVS